jgi:hypothetical protein
MRVLLVAVIGVAALTSLPAEASHWRVWPYFGFSYAAAPYHYGPWYGPYGPWYGPRVGVGVHVGGSDRGHRSPSRPAPARQSALKLYVYPAGGQSEAQTADDRYQCHVWAADQSGHDPTLGAGSREEAEGYTRAFTACMEGRNYVVR